jgi:23S rRNA (cytidine1920-2'-O)/16S rRNA (cytidine1409-2'-O)-methyltransferase
MPDARKKKVRLDAMLVERQLLADPKSAQTWIMSGAVLVNGQAITKPGTPVNHDAEILIRGLNQKYASRGGLKLEAALAAFKLSVTGRVVLDAGAAAGGFTDCLLQHGAAVVYAVDVGYGQIRGSLAADTRVRNRERTNIGDLRREDLVPAIDMCVADLSYLSLTKAVPILKDLFEGPPLMICLIKPLFEGVSQERKNSLSEFVEALDRLAESTRAHGLTITGLTVSPVLGSRGTIEFLGLLTESASDADGFRNQRDRVIQEVAEKFRDEVDDLLP